MTISPSDERRKDFRGDVPVCLAVEIPVALSYEAADCSETPVAPWEWEELALAPDLVKAMVAEKDLPIRDPLLLQVLTRIDWMLTSVIKALGKQKTADQHIPEFITVNLSGSGIRFWSDKKFSAGTILVLRIILRPFIPVQVVGKVTRVRSMNNKGKRRFEIAVEFTQIASEDREAIIRHLLRSQAAVQRLRNEPLHSSPN